MLGQIDVIVTDANVAGPSEFFDFAPEREGVLAFGFQQQLSPRVVDLNSNSLLNFGDSTSARFEVFANPFALLQEDVFSGSVELRNGTLLDMFGGEVRGLNLREGSGAFLIDGTVEALNPEDGFVLIDGATVGLGSYDPTGGSLGVRFQQPNESAANAATRISPLSSPLNASVSLAGGSLSGDLSLDTHGFLDVSGGTADVNLGSVAGVVDVSAGTVSDFSIDSLTGEVNILGSNLIYGATTVGTAGLTIDSSNLTGEIISGYLSDGNEFQLTVADITGSGAVNLFNDNSELPITGLVTEGETNGGSDFAGGVEVSFDSVTQDGTFTSDAQVTEAGNLDVVLDVTVAPEFEVTNDDAVQLWELDFDGQFQNDAELVFGYDELLLGDIPEEELAIYHFDESLQVWESLPVLERDTTRNWLRVRTRNFSPFVLGVSAIPEPTSTVLLMGLLLTATGRRFRRTSTNEQA